MLHAVGRLILVPLAFVLAALVALAIVVTLGLERLTQLSVNEPAIDWMFDVFTGGMLLTSGATLLPALCVAIVGEVARIRSWLYYLIGGGLALAMLPLMGVIEKGEAINVSGGGLWQVLATAGFAGGFVYWLIAGRTA